MSKPATPAVPPGDGQLGDLHRARLVPHRGQQLPDHDPAPGRRTALVEPLLDGGHDLVEGQPLGDVLLGRVAHLGVHDAVGGQVLHALAGDPGQRRGGLHHRDRVVERLEVALQRAGVGGLGEPAAERLGVGRGQLVADLGGEVDDRLRPEPAVEVVVEQHLGRAQDLVASGSRHPPILPSMRTFTTLDEVAAATGEELGTSDWLTIDQERVNQFADATGDHQWIHVDVERAKAGPFGGTIAHGYLTLSLVPWLGSQVFSLETPGAKLNYGVNKVRFPNPVRVGSRIRAHRHRRRGHRAARRQAAHPQARHRDRGRGQARLRRRDRRPAPSLGCRWRNCGRMAGSGRATCHSGAIAPNDVSRPGRSPAGGLVRRAGRRDVVAALERGQGAVEALGLVGEQGEQRLSPR